MIRERALKVVMVIVGLLMVATVYPLVRLPEDETLQLMLSIYVTLGVFGVIGAALIVLAPPKVRAVGC